MNFNQKIDEGENLISKGRKNEALTLFAGLNTQIKSNTTVLNNLGVILYSQGKLFDAESYFNQALIINPNYSTAEDNLSDVQNEINKHESEYTCPCKGLKIAISGQSSHPHQKAFLNYVSKENTVKFIDLNSDMAPTISWADYIFIFSISAEFFQINNYCPVQKIILWPDGNYYLEKAFVDNVKWHNIKAVIHISDHLRDISNELWPDIFSTFENFSISPPVLFDKMPPSKPIQVNNIGFIQGLHQNAGPDLFLQCAAYSIKHNPNLTYHICSNSHEQRFVSYLEHLSSSLGLNGRVKVFPKPYHFSSFFDEVDALLSTSSFESWPAYILEGMAIGLKPVIHSWRGARSLFPEEYIFKGLEDYNEIISRDNENFAGNKAWVSKNFNLDIFYKKIHSFFKKCIEKQ